jgi:PleD family two-component response regulator
MVAMTAPDVLLVEDSEFMSMRIIETLEDSHNMSLTAVGTAAEAKDRLIDNTFDCVVVNYELPDETGVELADSLNPSGRRPVVPIILLTGRELEPIAADAIEKGVTEFVYKGDHATANMDVLANRIRVVLKTHSLPEESN